MDYFYWGLASLILIIGALVFRNTRNNSYHRYVARKGRMTFPHIGTIGEVNGVRSIFDGEDWQPMATGGVTMAAVGGGGGGGPTTLRIVNSTMSDADIDALLGQMRESVGRITSLPPTLFGQPFIPIEPLIPNIKIVTTQPEESNEPCQSVRGLPLIIRRRSMRTKQSGSRFVLDCSGSKATDGKP